MLMHQYDKLYFYGAANIFKNYQDKTKQHGHGLPLLEEVLRCFARNLAFHDRSETITTPINTVTIPGSKLPTLVPQLKTFEDICNERALELYNTAVNNNSKLTVMYSGGVDSTLVVVSLLKVLTEKQLRDNVIILMSDDSIFENKNFYENYIRKYFYRENSKFFHMYLGNPKYLLVNGEGNDQLFGSAVLSNNTHLFSATPWTVKLTPDIIIKYFENNVDSIDNAVPVYEILDRVCKNAPIPIDTVYKWFWWINFTCKWQSVYMRSASFAAPQNYKTFRLEKFQMFFSPQDFQLWSMNNSDNLIGESFKQFKKVCKDIIFEYNNDEEYYKFKVKYGSLRSLLLKKDTCLAIDEKLNFIMEFNEDQLFNKNNSFMPT